MAFLLNFDPGDETDQFTHRYNIVQGTTSCVTVATSILATFIIGAQIYASTTMNRQARKRYKHIIEIIIQSSALYSFSILIGAVTALIGDNATITTSDSVIFNADIYAAAIGGFTTVYSLFIFSLLKFYLSFTILLAICPHSHGRAYTSIEIKADRRIFDQHNV